MQCMDYCLNHNYFWYRDKYYQQVRGIAMGARFASRVANLFMDMWESDQIFQCSPPELKIYYRYIENIFFIWEGDMSSLEAFQQSLNANNKGIELTWHVGPKIINFLDFPNQGKFTYHQYSFQVYGQECHHRPWLYNIPRGQFVQ